jgi:hypothetical protein
MGNVIIRFPTSEAFVNVERLVQVTDGFGEERINLCNMRFM